MDVATVLLESFTAYQDQDIWNDQVAVFLKDRAELARHPRRMLERVGRYMMAGCMAARRCWLGRRPAKTG